MNSKKRVYHTTESLGKLIETSTDGEYKLKSNYIKSSEKVDIWHKDCNSIYQVTPNHFLKGKRCPVCWKKRLSELAKIASGGKWDTDRLKNEVKSAVGGEYTVLGEYVSSQEPFLIRHNSESCENHTYKVKSALFFAKSGGSRCPKCDEVKRNERISLYNPKKTTLQFKKEVSKMHNGEYVFIGEYVNNKVNSKFLHKKCGNTFSMTPNDFQQGCRCSICHRILPKESKPILEIKDVLNKHGINF